MSPDRRTSPDLDATNPEIRLPDKSGTVDVNFGEIQVGDQVQLDKKYGRGPWRFNGWMDKDKNTALVTLAHSTEFLKDKDQAKTFVNIPASELRASNPELLKI